MPLLVPLSIGNYAKTFAHTQEVTLLIECQSLLPNKYRLCCRSVLCAFMNMSMGIFGSTLVEAGSFTKFDEIGFS
jgi:hypothetical protein